MSLTRMHACVHSFIQKHFISSSYAASGTTVFNEANVLPIHVFHLSGRHAPNPLALCFYENMSGPVVYLLSVATLRLSQQNGVFALWRMAHNISNTWMLPENSYKCKTEWLKTEIRKIYGENVILLKGKIKKKLTIHMIEQHVLKVAVLGLGLGGGSVVECFPSRSQVLDYTQHY